MRAILVICGLAVLAGAIWLVLSPSAGTSGDEPSRAESPDDKAVTASEGQESAQEGGSGPALETRRFAGDAPSADDEPPGVTVITGRCVAAEDGRPLSGVRIDLRGSARSAEKADAYRTEHGAIDWTAPEPRQTGADGRFRLHFVPPPPFGFRLVLRHERRITASRVWPRLEPGEQVDLGELPLVLGVQLRGVVVDSRNRPQAGIVVVARRAANLRGEPSEDLGQRGMAVTDADGAFAMSELFSPGIWRLHVPSRALVDPDEGLLRLESGRERAEARVILEPLEPKRRISGVVVDAEGEKVQAARMEFQGAGRCVVRNGRFEHTRRPGSPDGPFEVLVTAAGYEPRRLERRLAWGDEDVRIVLEAGPRLEVVVTEAGTGDPVEDFGVLLVASPAPEGAVSSRGRGPLASGHHPGGRALLEPQRRGSYVVMAVPLHDALVAGPLRRIELDESKVVALEVHRAAERTIRVLGSGDAPIVGSRVEVVAPCGAKPLTVGSHVVRIEEIRTSWTGPGVCLNEGVTNENGELGVRVAAAVPVSIRVLGPGHPPRLFSDIRWGPAGQPLILRVAVGATLAGRIGPEALLEQIRPGLMNIPAGRRDQIRPGLRLCRPGRGRGRFPIGHAHVPLEEDGRFRLEGVPSGDWVVELVSTQKSGPRSFSARGIPIARVNDLRKGETRRLTIDGTDLLYGRVKGRILLDGASAVGVHPSLSGLIETPTGTMKSASRGNLQLDEDGQFELSLAPGRYRLVLQVPSGGEVTFLQAAELIEVASDQEVVHTWHLQKATVRLLVRASDGQTPVEGARLRLAIPEPHSYLAEVTTDATGRAELAGTAGSRVDVEVLPREFKDRAARRAWSHRTGRPQEELWIPVTRLTLAAGTQQEVVTLPPDAGY